MLDGGLECPVCVAGDLTKQEGFIVIDDPVTTFASPSFAYIDFDQMTADEWKEALKNRLQIGMAKFAPYHYIIGNGQEAILSPEAADDFEDWMAIGGCTCFQGHAPCSHCTHPGHPGSLEARDDCVVF